ncbi:MAG TPA: thioredoxin domain-containing protein [Anaerolineales bacterium]|nr:thioredoxin domain-containing protein [Anaerolineales bacterium]
MTNRLANETSPYLLQHAENPVDWYPWGSEAFEKARRENKPIFLSIGYAACHWCHVMAHESFENQSTAKALNNNFISIKVDREERPDIDSIFMNFVVSISGMGGWPLSIFLTPEGKPFYGGTYFPPFRSHNLPSFREILDTVSRLWMTNRSSILSSSENLTRDLQSRLPIQTNKDALTPAMLNQAVQIIGQNYDWQTGGWGTAQKFPQPMLIEFLLRQASRGDRASLDMAVHALQAMCQGGMYDVLGGGFARYSVESTWLVPHFEKMLYDNAQLALVYLHAYQLSGEPAFRQVCEATLDFTLRELTHPQGGFYSSQDADSEGQEGKFYLWTPEEIRSALANQLDADLFITAYGVTEQGNFEGRNILRQIVPDEQLVKAFHMDVPDIHTRLIELRHQLLQVRDQRIHPATDDKVLVSWNALMLTALAEAGTVLDRQDYLEAAIRNAGFILQYMLRDNRLLRSWRDGVARHTAYLEDYAGLGLALLSLYQADFQPRWYTAALQLLEQILAHFLDASGGFFDTPDDHEALLYRPRDPQDNATPSGNALAVGLLLQLAAYEGSAEWRKMAEDLLSTNLGMLGRYPSAFAQWWCAADFALGPTYEVAIIGDLADPAAQALIQPLQHGYHPRLVYAASPISPLPGSPSLLNNRPLLGNKPTAYVCQDFACQLPVNDAEAMLAQL